MREPNSIQRFIEHEQMNPRNRANKDDWDVQQPLQPVRRVAAIAHLEEWDCECVQVDVDEWDARGCPLHGPHSEALRSQKEQEAADLVAYYSGPDPFEEQPPSQTVDEEKPREQRRTNIGERKMKEVVKFVVDTPVEVALRFETGKHVEGRYGDQVMYSLLDNRVMYVPPYVEQRIRELAIAAGEPLQLCKQAKTDGNRKWIEWSVRRPPQQPRTSPNETAAAGSAQSKAQNHANGSTNGKANGSSEKALAVMPSQVTGAGITAMELALNGAAEIAHRVEGRAASKNYSLRFSNEDIRAIGLTLFIQAMRDGGARWQQ